MTRFRPQRSVTPPTPAVVWDVPPSCPRCGGFLPDEGIAPNLLCQCGSGTTSTPSQASVGYYSSQSAAPLSRQLQAWVDFAGQFARLMIGWRPPSPVVTGHQAGTTTPSPSSRSDRVLPRATTPLPIPADPVDVIRRLDGMVRFLGLTVPTGRSAKATAIDLIHDIALVGAGETEEGRVVAESVATWFESQLGFESERLAGLTFYDGDYSHDEKLALREQQWRIIDSIAQAIGMNLGSTTQP